MPESLSVLQRTATAAGWVIGWRVATRLLGLVSTLILVRLLVPADFGLVALGASFAQAIEGFSWIGVEEALIREKTLTREAYDTGFTLTILRSTISGAAVLALAWPAGDFFNEPRMTGILVALAISTAMDGFINIGTVDFRRDFAFDKEFRLWILPRLASMAATLTVAAVFHSYWALISGILLQRVLRVYFSYRMHPYRPGLSLRAWRQLLGYSMWSWGVSVLVLLRERCDSIVIGRLLDPTRVGIYTIAAEIAALPTSELVQPLCRAAFTGFATEQSAELNPGATYLRLIATATLLTLPAAVGISLVAPLVVAVAFGPLWVEAGPLIAMLALAGSMTVIGNISSTLLQARGLMRATLQIELAVLLTRIVLLVIFVDRYGLWGAAVAAAVAISAEQGIYAVMTFRRFRVRLSQLVGAVWRSAAATGAMTGVLLWSGFGLPEHGEQPVLMLLTASAVGATVYGVTLSGLWWLGGLVDGAESDVMALGRRMLGRRRAT